MLVAGDVNVISKKVWLCIVIVPVGYSADRRATHFCVTQVGTRSTLLRTRMRCLWVFSVFMYFSMCCDRVPIGSRASRTWD